MLTFTNILSSTELTRLL